MSDLNGFAVAEAIVNFKVQGFDVLQSQMQRLGQTMEGLGGKFTLAFTIPAIAGLTGMLRATMLEDSAMTKLNSTMNQMNVYTERSVRLNDRLIMQYQRMYAQQRTESMRMLQQAYAFGIPREQIARVTQTAIGVSSLYPQIQRDQVLEYEASLMSGNPSQRLAVQMQRASGGRLRLQGRSIEQQQEVLSTAGAQGLNVANAQSKTLEGQLNILKDTWEEVLAVFGESAKGPFSGIIKSLQTTLDYINKLPGSTKQWILSIGGVLAALGPVIYTLGALKNSWQVLTGTTATARLAQTIENQSKGASAIEVAEGSAAGSLLGGKLKEAKPNIIKPNYVTPDEMSLMQDAKVGFSEELTAAKVAESQATQALLVAEKELQVTIAAENDMLGLTSTLTLDEAKANHEAAVCTLELAEAQRIAAASNLADVETQIGDSAVKVTLRTLPAIIATKGLAVATKGLAATWALLTSPITAVLGVLSVLGAAFWSVFLKETYLSDVQLKLATNAKEASKAFRDQVDTLTELKQRLDDVNKAPQTVATRDTAKRTREAMIEQMKEMNISFPKNGGMPSDKQLATMMKTAKANQLADSIAELDAKIENQKQIIASTEHEKKYLGWTGMNYDGAIQDAKKEIATAAAERAKLKSEGLPDDYKEEQSKIKRNADESIEEAKLIASLSDRSKQSRFGEVSSLKAQRDAALRDNTQEFNPETNKWEDKIGDSFKKMRDIINQEFNAKIKQKEAEEHAQNIGLAGSNRATQLKISGKPWQAYDVEAQTAQDSANAQADVLAQKKDLTATEQRYIQLLREQGKTEHDNILFQKEEAKFQMYHTEHLAQTELITNRAIAAGTNAIVARMNAAKQEYANSIEELSHLERIGGEDVTLRKANAEAKYAASLKEANIELARQAELEQEASNHMQVSDLKMRKEDETAALQEALDKYNATMFKLREQEKQGIDVTEQKKAAGKDLDFDVWQTGQDFGTKKRSFLEDMLPKLAGVSSDYQSKRMQIEIDDLHKREDAWKLFHNDPNAYKQVSAGLSTLKQWDIAQAMPHKWKGITDIWKDAQESAATHTTEKYLQSIDRNISKIARQADRSIKDNNQPQANYQLLNQY